MRCRKALNRLLGGPSPADPGGARNGTAKVTHTPDAFRVHLDGKHVASYPTRELAEMAIAAWLREWDGEFTIQAKKRKGKW